jgi:predicted DNA-binding protein
MARPALPFTQANTEETRLRLPPPVDELITQEAAALGIPKAVFVRSIIMERYRDKLPKKNAA